MNPLLPLELVWRSINDVRRRAYRRGMIRQARLPRPVISVGNISAGGSGKTPTVIHIARTLVSRGWRVAVLSRGYRRAGTGIAAVTADDPEQFGDEPVLIRRHVPEADVIVGPSRYDSGRWLLGRNDCDVFLLDDGFQHLQLHRDIDVVIDDPSAAHLRESRTAFEDADLILYRGGRSVSGRDDETFQLQIEPTALVLGGERHGLGMFVGKKIAAFSGLANNERFFRSIESLGGRIVARESFRDHASYDDSTLEALQTLKRNSGADLLVTTEKDWVKFPTFEVAVLIVEAVITPLAPFHETLVEKLETSCRSLGRIVPAFERTHGL